MTKVRLAALVIIVLALGVVWKARSDRQALLDLAEACVDTRLSGAERVSACTDLLDTAPKTNANQIFALYERAEIYYQRKDYAPAMVDLDAVLGLDHDYSKALWLKSSILHIQGEDEKAAELFRQVASLHPESERAQSRFYSLLFYAKDFEAAKNQLDVIAVKYPDTPWLDRAYGYVYAALGQHQKAMSALIAAIARTSDDTKAFKKLINVCRTALSVGQNCPELTLPARPPENCSDAAAQYVLADLIPRGALFGNREAVAEPTMITKTRGGWGLFAASFVGLMISIDEIETANQLLAMGALSKLLDCSEGFFELPKEDLSEMPETGQDADAMIAEFNAKVPAPIRAYYSAFAQNRAAALAN